MENWLNEPSVLRSMAKHWRTGEAIPDELIRKIRASNTFRAASGIVRQLKLALTDLDLHDGFLPSDAAGARTIWDVERAVEARTRILPPLPEDRFLCSFRHIFAGGYSAGYYS
jgi:oligopeptidase A